MSYVPPQSGSLGKFTASVTAIVAMVVVLLVAFGEILGAQEKECTEVPCSQPGASRQADDSRVKAGPVTADEFAMHRAVGPVRDAVARPVSADGVFEAHDEDEAIATTANELSSTATWAVDAQRQEMQGDSHDDTQQRTEASEAEAFNDEADVRMEANGSAAVDGTGIERTEQVLVQRPPVAGFGGAAERAEPRDRRVTWAVIVLLVAVAMIALDWLRRRRDTSK